MTYTLKCMKLDLLLLKPYLKSMLLALLVPVLITFFTGTLFDGLSFSATVMAMTTGYTFAVVEKNSLDRFYGFLPAKRKALVSGRYLVIFTIGFTALFFTLLVQTAILTLRSAMPSISEMAGSYFICAVLFCIYAGVQIPGYYRFGSIKGKMFMFIPTVGFLLFYYAAGLLADKTGGAVFSSLPGPQVLLAGAIAFIILTIAISVFFSIRIVERDKN